MGGEIRQLVIGGMPWSDNTGFVCAPDSAQRALPAFAVFMQHHLRWDLFDMRNVSDRRLDLFLSRFSPESFYTREVAGTVCPHVLLPDSWERYLREFLGPCTRKHLKYYMKKAERLSGFRAVHTREDNLEQQIDALLALWQARWGAAPEAVLNVYRTLFSRCAAAGTLCLTTLWEGNAPFAAEAAFTDRKQGVFSGYTTGFNHAFASLSPGNVMTGFHIRHAIENGFRIYDFGAGGEKYKYSFGTRERTNRNLFIKREPIFVRMKNSVPSPLKRVIRKLVMR
ncbi:MAG: GNAT family N-acetyltransferase [Thermodesulfovibrionales bacterium]